MFLRTRQLPGLKVAALAVALAAGVGLPGGRCAEESAIAVTNSVPLAYHEVDYTVASRSINFKWLHTPFSHEPEVPKGRVMRGILHFGGNDSNDVPFIWHCEERKIFLDLNRNRDLTDDPNGVFVAPPTNLVGWQSFTNIPFSFDSPMGRWMARVNFQFYGYHSYDDYLYLSVRSFWGGKLSLHGRDWQVGLVSDLRANQAGPVLTNLLLRPWAERDRPFNNVSFSPDTVPLAGSLFFDGHVYRVSLSAAGGKTNEFQPVLQFVEQPVSLGEVQLTGQFLRRAVLLGDGLTVVLDHPAGAVTVPVGNYRQVRARLEQGGVEVWLKNEAISPVLSVNPRTPVALEVGGPLTNSVAVSRRGEDLVMTYRLIGTGGREYQRTVQNQFNRPEFAVFLDGKKITSGTFEYG